MEITQEYRDSFNRIADYNGWTNYPTWNVKLWLDNDEGNYRELQRLTESAMEESAEELDIEQNEDYEWEESDLPAIKDNAVGYLEDYIKDYVTENCTPDIPNGMHADIMGWAMDFVCWREIAMNYLDDI